MKVFVGSDHAGFELKAKVVAHLKSLGHEAVDCGPHAFDPEDDFQDLAAGETREVTFTYTATDSHGDVSNTGSVTVTVTGTNDAPTVTDVSA